MVKLPPFETDRTYFNRDAKPWIEQNRTWNKAQIDVTLDTLWADATIKDLYRTHRAGANANTLAAYVPGRVAIPLHPYINADKTTARQAKRAPPQRNAAGGLLVTPPAPPAPPAPTLPAVRVDQGTQTIEAPTAASAAPAVPSTPGLTVTPATPPTPSGPSVASIETAAEPGTITAPGPAAVPTNLYQFDFWPPQPWDVDPDTSGIPSLKVMKAPHYDIQDDYLNVEPLQWKVDESDWRGAYCFYPGSYGNAALYCQVNSENNIIDRMVVKDCQLPAGQYSNPTHWRDQLPKEIALHRRIDRKRKRDSESEPEFDKVVEHRGYRLMMRRRRYRLYLEYYAGGELSEPLSGVFHQWSKAVITDDESIQAISREELISIPTLDEGFIWYVFHALVKALMILHHGTTSQTVTDPAWKPITHLDLSIHNIFIQTNPKEKKNPLVVLSDLGMGFFDRDTPPVTDGEEPLPTENPFEYVWNSKEPTHPIEHQFVTENPPYKLNEKTDVWKVGSLIWELMTHGRDENKPMREDSAFIDSDGELMYTKESVTGEDHSPLTSEAMFPADWRFYPMADKYSFALKSLVRNCLHWTPSTRATLKRLDREIGNFIRDNPEVMENAAAPLEIEMDKFAVGKRFKRRMR